MSTENHHEDRLLVIGAATRDTFLELSTPHGEHESVGSVKGLVERLGGKGYLVASAYEAVIPGRAALLAEVASEDSAFNAAPYTIQNFLKTLDSDSRIWVVTGVDGGQRTYIKRGVRLTPLARMSQLMKRAFREADSIYLSEEHMNVLETVGNFLASAPSAAPRPRLVLNPCMPLQITLRDRLKLLKILVESASMILCNQYEMPLLVKSLGRDPFPPAKEIVVTSGAEGGSYSSDGGNHWSSFAACPITASSSSTTAGGGDIFNGTLMAYRAGGLSFSDSIIMAASAASSYIVNLQKSLTKPE